MTVTILHPTPIKALLGLTRLKDGDVTPLLDASLAGLEANATIYTKPPVDLATYGAGINAYKSLIPAAADGGKTAIATKNKARRAAIKMYTLNAHYVEATCNDDLQTFLLSGYKPKPSTKTLTTPVSDSFRKVDRGKLSGTAVLTLMRDPKASSYTVRYGQMVQGAAPATWITLAVSGVRPPTTITGLTPGTTYAFQVRSLLPNNTFSDWSDSVTLMIV